MKTTIHIYLTSLIVISSITLGGGQPQFANQDFEDPAYCDPSDCEDTDISCVTNWWNFADYVTEEDRAWVYYDDLAPCLTEDITLESCGDERGMKIFTSTGVGHIYPATANPFHNWPTPSDYYVIGFDLNFWKLTTSGVSIEIYVADDVSISTATETFLIGKSEVFTNKNECIPVSIPIIDPLDVARLLSYPYIFFKPDSEAPSPPEEPINLDFEGVIDNLETCNLFDFSYSTLDCDMLCFNWSTDCILSCNSDRLNDPELDDCYIFIEVRTEPFPNGEVLEECYFDYIGNGQCCFDVPEYDTYIVTVETKFQLQGQLINPVEVFEISYQPCSTVVISANTTWTTNDIDQFDRFEEITVASGYTLTIEDDVIVKFCEDGELIIEPNARVILHGTLTADCEAGWQGVEVQGNANASQYPVSSTYSQGRLFCEPGSTIEHAYTAVRLYGPNYGNSGGQIYAEGAFFLNNQKGLDFAPFKNIVPSTSIESYYLSTISDCTFDITAQYLLPQPFLVHIEMHRINGVDIIGSYFGNNLTIPGAIRQMEYGVGIKAIGAGFDVLPLGACSPPCNPTRRCEFYGLGMGIMAGKARENRPFKVYNSWFQKCFFGIVNNSVSGADILFNTFEMGHIHELSGDEDQIGISLSDYIAGMQVQENRFVRSAGTGNADHLLGIVAKQIGTMDQAVRKNYFYEMDVANESVGVNGRYTGTGLSTGLRYLCNQNTDNTINDFYVVPADLKYHESGINQGQYYPGIQAPLATGNTFSTTGDPDDGDFGNYGDWMLRYIYYASNSSEIPQDYIGIDPSQSDQNPCSQAIIFQPNLTEEEYGDAYEFYFQELDSLNLKINFGDSIAASYYKFRTDSVLQNIFRYYEYDTTGYSIDSIQNWYFISGLLEAHLLLAGSQHGAGDFSKADATLDSILIWHSLSSDQILDIERIRYLYGIIESDTIPVLTQTQYDSLLLYSGGIGASYSLARSILSLYDTLIPPRYYIPGELTPRSRETDKYEESVLGGFNIFPNPASDELNIILDPSHMMAEFILFSLSGKFIMKRQLTAGLNTISTADLNLLSGIYIATMKNGDFYRISKIVISD